MTFIDCTADLVGQLNGNGRKGMLQIDAPSVGNFWLRHWKQVIAPGAARRYSPADGSSTRGGSTSVRGRLRSAHMANLQVASVPRAAAPWDRQTNRQTDGSRYRVMPPPPTAEDIRILPNESIVFYR